MRRSPSVSFGRGFDGRRAVHFIYSFSQSCGLPVGMGCTFTHLQFFLKKKTSSFFLHSLHGSCTFLSSPVFQALFLFFAMAKNRKRSGGRRKSGAEPLDPLLPPGPILSDSISVEPPLRSAAVGRRGEREREKERGGGGGIEGGCPLLPQFLSRRRRERRRPGGCAPTCVKSAYERFAWINST